MALMLGVVAVVAWGLLAAWLMASGIDHIPSADLTSLDAGGAGPTNYLLVGTDSREDLPAELGGFFGNFEGERADVIMLVHTLPGEGQVQILSIPRDFKVEIPGRGTNRVNAAYAFGGPELLVETVRRATGVPIHHYVEVRFGDFADVVDALGGVSVPFPYDARDGKSGLSVAAGTSHLDGPQAVAYVRSRSYEELQDGQWVAVGQGDIGRTARQQEVLSQLIDRATTPTRFLTMPFVGKALGDAIRADSGLGITEMIGLGFDLVRSGEFDAATVPVRDSTEGGVAFVVAVEPAAGNMFADFANGRELP